MNKFYLCVQKNNYDRYKCEYFTSFLAADKYCYKNYNYDVIFSTIIKVPWYMPECLHKFYLKQKICNFTVRIE